MKHFSLKKLLLLLVAAVGLLCPQLAMAQATHATIVGKITDSKGETVIGATVLVRNESTGFSTAVITNEKGDYTVQQVPLGSPYTVTAKYVGYGEQRKTGYTLNQGDMLRVNFTMKEQSVTIDEVQVVANSLRKSASNTGAATAVSAKTISVLPVNGRNFTSLIDLSPLSTGSSLGGQLSTSTNFTIDGMTAKNPTSGGTTNRNGGPYAITMEAVREFEVVTNQYDVTFGRSGGGTISTVTKSGTNTLKGSAFLFSRANWLSSPYDIQGRDRKVDFSTYQYGGSLGGAIIKDRAHFFIAWDHQEDNRPLYIADIQDAADEKKYNLSQTSLNRFLSIARAKYGVAASPQTGSFNKNQSTDAIFARVDWQLNPTNLLTVRNNYSNDRNKQKLDDNTTINLYEVYGDVKSVDNSLLATLRSVFGPKTVNELKLQHLYTSENSTPNTQLPTDNIPRAIVQNIKSSVDGKDVYTNIQLGGQRYCPENFYNNVVHLIDNLYYNTKRINYTLGLDFMYSNMNSRYGSETNGRFYYNGLDAFDNNQPYRYAREIYLTNDQRVRENIINSGIYGQLQTKLFKGFELMAGLRLDYADYLNAGAFNQTVFNTLGLRTDNKLSTIQIQPRIQTTWDIDDKHADIIRLGAGVFASDINNYAMINNMVFDGTRTASVDIQGALVPTANFAGYRSNPASAPGADLFNNPSIPKISTINMNASDVAVPVVYKANLSYTHFFSDVLKVGVSAYATLGRNNYMYVDANMVDQPFFRIASEGNRGVYVPAANISTTSGTSNWMDGRKSTAVGRVLEMNSKGKVNQYAFVIDGTYRYFRDGEISMSYTWNDTKDNTSYTGNVANSATLAQMVTDDPRDLSQMSYSNNQFRNKIVVYGTAPSFWGVNLGVRFSGMSGTRYSMIVNGNVNGDFVATNDLAYVFDPNSASTSTTLKQGIQALLDNPSVEGSFKDYIRNSIGKVAKRNGGVNGFYGTIDLRLSKKIKTFKSQSLEISADIFNFANLLNKSWGVNHALGTQAIYVVKGFDATKKEFVYAVNPSAGVSPLSGNPYQIQIGLRYAF